MVTDYHVVLGCAFKVSRSQLLLLDEWNLDLLALIIWDTLLTGVHKLRHIKRGYNMCLCTSSIGLSIYRSIVACVSNSRCHWLRRCREGRLSLQEATFQKMSRQNKTSGLVLDGGMYLVVGNESPKWEGSCGNQCPIRRICQQTAV